MYSSSSSPIGPAGPSRSENEMNFLARWAQHTWRRFIAQNFSAVARSLTRIPRTRPNSSSRSVSFCPLASTLKTVTAVVATYPQRQRHPGAQPGRAVGVLDRRSERGLQRLVDRGLHRVGDALLDRAHRPEATSARRAAHAAGGPSAGGSGGRRPVSSDTTAISRGPNEKRGMHRPGRSFARVLKPQHGHMTAWRRHSVVCAASGFSSVSW